MAAYLLNFCANNRNPKVRYYASDMQLCGHTDASYLSVLKAGSCAASYYVPQLTFISPQKMAPSFRPITN